MGTRLENRKPEGPVGSSGSASEGVMMDWWKFSEFILDLAWVTVALSVIGTFGKAINSWSDVKFKEIESKSKGGN